MILCKVVNCNYHSVNGFCLNKFVTITPQGFCGRIYNSNGQMKLNWNTTIEERKQDEEMVNRIDDQSSDGTD